MNFSLKYFTSETEKSDSGTIYRFCFEYGYMFLPNDKICIVHRPELLNYPPLNRIG